MEAKQEKWEARQRVKRRLASYQHIKAEQEEIEDQLHALEATAYAPRTAQLDGMPHGGPKGDAMTNTAMRLDRLRRHYERLRSRLLDAQQAIEDEIETLEPVQRRILRNRYINNMTWEEVCSVVRYSWRQMHRIHGKALDKLAEKDNEGEMLEAEEV